MLLVLLPSFSSLFHNPSTCLTLWICASFPSCWTNSAYLHTLKLPFLKASSSYFPLYFELFQPFFLGLSSVVSPRLGTSLQSCTGWAPLLCGTTGQVSLQGALAMLLPALQAGFGSGAPAAHTAFLLHLAREGALLLLPSARRGMLWGMMLWSSPALQTQEFSLRLQSQDLFFQSSPCSSFGLIFSSQTILHLMCCLTKRHKI